MGGGRELVNVETSISGYNSIFGDIVNKIANFEHEESQGPALMLAKENEVLMKGMMETVEHITLAFKDGGPDLTDLFRMFELERDKAIEAIRVALANPPSPGPDGASTPPLSPGPAGGGSGGSGPGSPVGHERAFDRVFQRMVQRIKDAEYEDTEIDLRTADDNGIILAGLEETLVHLEAGIGGSRGSLGDLGRDFHVMRVAEEAEAGRLRAAGGGGGAGVASVGDLVEIRKLTQAIHVAEAAVAAAKAAYQPVKPSGATNKAKKRAHAQWKAANTALVEARQALADFKDSAGLPADPRVPPPEEPPALSET